MTAMSGKDHTRTAILGIPFFQGSCDAAVRIAQRGGLIVAPSGPGLAQDLVQDPAYAEAVRGADLALVDSGYLACLYFLFHRRSLRRISGLAFLQGCLEQWSALLQRPGSSLWVMPSAAESSANRQWLAGQGIELATSACYIAPRYPREKVEDEILLQRLREQQPDFVFINIGGGIQEKLGAWLRARLDPPPALICTGAAIAFMSGTQAPIPRWADKFYLGWLIRILWNPRHFLPRYAGAVSLYRHMRREAKATRRI